MQQAVYIDWHNLFKMCENCRINLDYVIGEIVHKAYLNGEVFEIRLFVPNYTTGTPWKIINSFQLKYPMEVSACPILSDEYRIGAEMKDTVDFKVFEWVIKHLHKNTVPNKIIFVTGDGHFILASNEAKRKGKKTEFWSVDSTRVHGLIKQQEDFNELKVSPPILLSKRNFFLETLEKFIRSERKQGINDGDRERMDILIRAAKEITEQVEEKKSPFKDASQRISKALNIKEEVGTDLLEALMALGIAKIYPSAKSVIQTNQNSSLFQWLLNQNEPAHLNN